MKSDDYFEFENCPLKHFVRIHGWLPAGRRRLKHLQSQRKSRRLRYFTFCAAGAIDVLMLDIANIVRRSTSGKFDSVVFFDKNPEAVNETQKNIPGSNGFPADFTSLVLATDPEEDNLLDAAAVDEWNVSEPDTRENRLKQNLLRQRRRFMGLFPFDIVNLDLEEYLLKPKEDFPGRVLQAVRKILRWQQRSLDDGTGLSEWSLMYTTQIGPPNLTERYLALLGSAISKNLNKFPDLRQTFVGRTGVSDAASLLENSFEEFFRIALPKLLVGEILAHDWYVNPDHGVQIYEFDRPSKSGPYKMLHLVIDIKRQDPPNHKRGTFDEPDGVEEAYAVVVNRIFSEKEMIVRPDSGEVEKLEKSLDKIRARRRKYRGDIA
ncbi:MAG TPA: hypothetical protein VNW97_03380 [Candidatus Saccharimonadales bacterium]|nr:hypothetical protein [Candidatus Saccharimonadales bacterium]